AQEVIARLPSSWGVLALPPVPGDPTVRPVRHTTHYRSTYFDTPDLATVRAHVQGRRRRWKARSRLYVEDGLCRTEVKAKDGRGLTVKTAADCDAAHYGCLTDRARTFLSETLAGHRIEVDPERLWPSVEVTYERMTFARVDEQPARMTLDWGVTGVPTAGTATARGRERVWVDRDHVLLETKGGLQPCDADRLLGGLGVRPRSFSKYAASATVLHPGVADNDVRRLLGRLLHHGPAADGPVSDTRTTPTTPAVPTGSTGSAAARATELWSRSA
ncbi:MAG: hypothetical protein JWR42_284, partial [Marmoricola sp.]|nr:hypothetical protein [Marmoricola sp.]